MKRLLIFLLFASSLYGQGGPLTPAASSSGAISGNSANCFSGVCVVLHMATSNVGYSVTVSGTWTGTLTIEQSGDNQTTWTSVTTTTVNTLYTSALTPGITDARVRGSAAMTGAAVVTITASGPATLQNVTGGSSSASSSLPTKSFYLASTCPSVDLNITCFVIKNDGQVTYGASWSNGSPTITDSTSIGVSAASVSGNVATLTVVRNPLTTFPAAWAIGNTVVITGFTGGDTFFNGTFTLTGVTATTITYALVHANASATSQGFAQNTNIGHFLPADAGVGKRAFSTNDTGSVSARSSVVQCGATAGTTILTYTDSAHVNLSSNCTAASIANTPFWYGSDDTAALVAASAAVGNACGTLLLPGLNAQNNNFSILFTTKGLFRTIEADCVGAAQGNMWQGVTIRGTSSHSSWIMMLPDFDPTTCTDIESSCFGYRVTGNQGGMFWEGFTISGGGNSSPGAGFNGKTLVQLGVATTLRDVHLRDFGGNQTGLTGLALGSSIAPFGPIQLDDVQVDGWGHEPLVVSAIQAAIYGHSYAGDSAGAALTIAAGGELYSTGNIYGPAGPGFNPCQVIVNGNGLFHSKQDQINLGQSSGSTCSLNNGGTALLDDDNLSNTANSSGPLTQTSGSAITRARNTNFGVTGTASASISVTAGTFDNQGGNTLNGSSGPYVNTTTSTVFIADGHSLTGVGTGVCSASVTIGLRISGTSTTGAGIPTTCTSVVLDAGIPMTQARTLMNLVVHSTAVGVSGVVTVLKNGGATTITCSMAGVTFCTDGLHTVSVVTGDLISIQVVTGAAETLANVKAYVEWN